MGAASPAYFFTAACSALPPSSTYNRGSLKFNPRFSRSPNNSPTTVAFSVAPCQMPRIVLRPSWPTPNAATICCPSNGVASISNAEPALIQPALHHRFQLRPARFDEVFADGALLPPVSFGELAHRLAVLPGAQAQHQLLPDRLGQRLAPMEHLVRPQPHFFVRAGAHARPLDRPLLPHHHAVALLTAPPVGLPFRLPLAALAGPFPNFFLHQQLHQLQSRLPNQFAHSFS